MASTSTQMASDSSPSMRRCLYDVFLSFRGEDTRNNFTDHLYTELIRKGITTFRDDQLRRGEEIQPKLLKAIEESKSSIVVFSKNYADSRWCLEELAKIMECRKEYGQIVLPIFYHVDPSDIRKQRGSFGEAFTTKYDYEENWKDKAERWREALTQAGNISGWHIKEGYESKHINEITTTITKRILNCKLLIIEDNLVGMHSHFKNLSLELRMESKNVRMIGICGIGGIGKTTIAGYVYNQISWSFECSSFLENVREVYKNKGPLRLQNQLLNDILDGENKKISNVRQGAEMIKNSLHFRKALIIFDDIDNMDQLESLVGNHDWYGEGSRVIITTRDKHLLTKMDYQYDVEVLKTKEALELFSQHAFQPNIPRDDSEDLLNRVLHYCQGLPLALKVLGSFLCDKTKCEWQSELHKLEKEPDTKIQNVLKISFDGLDAKQKVVFLDIACFFEDEDRDFVSKVLDGCDLYGEINIRVLWERCLINISHNRIYMHDLIRRMGKKIVQEQYPEEPSEWSRLWTSSDIYYAFINEKEMKNVETISLAFSISNEESDQVKKVFAKMKKLRLLKVHYTDTYEGHGYKMPNPRGFGFPPNLRYLHWEGLESWPSNFHGENLVAINLKSSNIKELLTGKKYLAELKFIDLSNSKRLIKLPELSRMPKLEKLNLKGCTSFCKLHSSIGTFSEMIFLKELNFSGSGIRELPSNIGSWISLETLNLSKCLKFEKFPDRIFENMECLKVLVLYESGIKELPNSIGHLQSLQSLNLSGCSNFKKFPEIKRNMKSLKRLVLDNTAIRELPTSIGCLKALEFLSLCGCLNFEKFPEIQNNMESLREIFLGNSGIKELSCWITCLPGLAHLDLENCKNLRSFPSNICRLKSLQHLSLEGCSNLEVFPEMMEDMEHLRCLYLRDLIISGLPSISIEHLKGLRCLELNNCENLETLPNSIGNLTCLGALVVHNSPKLQKLPDTLKNLQCCLKVLDLSGCHLMEGAIPSDIWCLFSLISLSLSENNILRIPVGIIHLSQLRELRMNHCPMLEEIPELPTSLRSIEAHGCPCLETLSTLPKHLLWSYLLNCFKSQIQDLGKETFVRCEINGPIVLHETNVVIPGNRGLPKWIHHKTKGNEIRIELPKNCYEDDNFLGFALFFHLVPLGEENDSDDTCNVIDERQSENIPQVVKLQISHGDQFENVDDLWAIQICKFHSISGLGYRTFDEYKKGSTSSPNPALLVVYYPRISISSRYRSSGCNNFKARFTGLFICGEVPFKVKSCGIHLIYDGDALDHHGKQGIQLFDVKTGHDTTSHQIKTSLPSNSFHRVRTCLSMLQRIVGRGGMQKEEGRAHPHKKDN